MSMRLLRNRRRALFAGIFIVRYHLELILFVPLAAGMFAYSTCTSACSPNSPVQSREAVPSAGSSRTWWSCFTIVRAADVREIPVLYLVQRRAVPDQPALDPRRERRPPMKA